VRHYRSQAGILKFMEEGDISIIDVGWFLVSSSRQGRGIHFRAGCLYRFPLPPLIVTVIIAWIFTWSVYIQAWEIGSEMGALFSYVIL
jgi:hypothetical protein